jgi:hypothetical protein
MLGVEFTQKELKKGNEFFFNNEEFQESIGEDDIREARVEFDDNFQSWAKGFKIWFNGMLVHHSKTFSSMERKLNELKETWNLEQADEL